MNSEPSCRAGQTVTPSTTTRQQDGQGLRPQHAADDRPVEPDQEPVHRVAVLRDDPAAHEQHHQRRHQRHRQQRGRRHGEGLGEGERPEQPALLALQREDRQERHGDDEQAEEQRRPDLARRLDQDLDPRLVGRRALQMLVGVLDHDDGGVDHGADGDGDAAEAHDVGAEPEQPSCRERHQDADRQHEDGDQRAADVQQEHDADERDDDALLDQRDFSVSMARVDQLASGRRPARSPCLRAGSARSRRACALTFSMTSGRWRRSAAGRCRSRPRPRR